MVNLEGLRMPTNTANIGWTTLRLADDEREMLGRFAIDTTSDPYANLPQFRGETSRAAAELSATTRAAVSALADGTSDRPALYIDNLPESASLPSTPIAVADWRRTTRDTMSEFLMLAITEGLGHPIAYLDQRNGKIFHDIYPTAENAAAVSSQSFKVGLGFHTEMFFHPEPPDFVLLHCLRPDPAGIATTSVAALDDIEECLSKVHRNMLRQRRYALDLASLHGRYVHAGNPITQGDPRPIISIASGGLDPRFRFEPALTTPPSTGKPRRHWILPNRRRTLSPCVVPSNKEGC